MLRHTSAIRLSSKPSPPTKIFPFFFSSLDLSFLDFFQPLLSLKTTTKKKKFIFLSPHPPFFP